MSRIVLREFVERLQRDVAKVDESATIGIYNLNERVWTVLPSTTTWTAPEDFGDDGWVGRIYGSDFLLNPDDDDLAATLEELAEECRTT